MLHKLYFYQVNLDDENSSCKYIHATIHDCVWFSKIHFIFKYMPVCGYVGVSTGELN